MKQIRFIIILIIILTLVAVLFYIIKGGGWLSEGGEIMAQKITLKTKDGVIIVADYYEGPLKYSPAIILLHMMPVDRSSWREFAPRLQEAGWQVLAIDLRGHGESLDKNGQRLNYKQFSDTEHQASRADVDAALRFFIDRGIAKSQIKVIGASIGANLALDLLHRDPNIPAAVLLSPGLDYHGIKTEAMVSELSAKQNQKFFIIASEGDDYSAESSAKLAEKANVPVKLKIFDKSDEHGTDIFNKHPDLMKEIIEWLGI